MFYSAVSVRSFALNGATLTAKLPGRMDEDSADVVPLAIARDKLVLFDAETTKRIAR